MKKVFILTFFFILSLVLSVLISGYVTKFLSGLISSDAITFVSYALMMVLTITAVSIFAKTRGWRVASPRPRFGRIDFTLLLASYLVILSLSILTEPLVSLFPDSYLDGMYDSMNGGIWSICTVIVAAPILEEFLCRGLLQRNFVKFTNPYVGVLCASVLFGLIHIIPQQAIMAFFSGLVMGVVFLLTRSLFTVIMIHMVNNGVAYIINLYFGRCDGYSDLIDLSAKGEIIMYSVCGTIVILATIFAVMRIEKIAK